MYMESGERNIVLNAIQAIKNKTKTLSLSHSLITPYGAHIISESLKSSNKVQKLDFNGNSIEMEGSKAIADMVEVNQSIQMLRLSSNNLSDE
mmetsp:Transcript_18471/g.16348  ORF Transcript_18471/g.16348 Transcript_18471/m.16348 type:complete len:92 (+) Transcript_18471:876-1151(+)